MKKILMLLFIIFITACESSSSMSQVEEILESPPSEESIESDEPVAEDTSEIPVIEDNGDEVVEEEPTEDVENVVEISTVFRNEFNPEELGSIGVLANWLDPNRSYPFLEGLDALIFNQYDQFKQFDFDTKIIFYEAELINFYPSQNWGIPTLKMGDIVVEEDNGSKIIMARFPAYEEAIRMISEVDYRFLSIMENSTLDEYFSWQENNPISKAVILPIDLTESEIEQISNFDLNDLELRPLDYCKIEQNQRFPNDPPQSKGFPLGYNVVNPTGIINIAVVAVDFPDVRGPEYLIEQYAKEMPLVEEWSRFMTSGLMEYRIHFSDQWVRAPKDAIWYGCPSCMRVIRGDYSEDAAPRLQPETDAINQLFQAADDIIDWTSMDFVYFIFPPEAEIDPHYVMVYSHGGNYFTQNAGRFSIPVYGKGMAFPDPTFTDYGQWDFLIHEVLHEQGLMGHGPYNGSDLSIMMNQHGYSKMVLGWEAFLLGWWDEKQLSCIGIEDIEEPLIFEFDSLDRTGFNGRGQNSLIIRMNDDEVIVIDYRTDGPMSDLPTEWHGITAYNINVNTPQYRCDDCNVPLIEYEARNFWRYLKDENRTQPCIDYRQHPVYGSLDRRFCNDPRFTHAPGAILSHGNLQIAVISENVVRITRTIS